MIEGIEDIKAAIKELKQELFTGTEDILSKQAIVLTDNVRKRIREGGITPYKKLSDYSEKGKHTHKKDRVRAGLQVEYKDLTFTGAMLDGLAPKKPKVSKSKKTVTVLSDVSNKAKSGKGKNKKVHTVIVEKLTQQEKLSEGTVIDATEKELEEAYKPLTDWIENIIKTKLKLS